jgi:hypothetical protein
VRKTPYSLNLVHEYFAATLCETSVCFGRANEWQRSSLPAFNLCNVVLSVELGRRSSLRFELHASQEIWQPRRSSVYCGCYVRLKSNLECLENSLVQLLEASEPRSHSSASGSSKSCRVCYSFTVFADFASQVNACSTILVMHGRGRSRNAVGGVSECSLILLSERSHHYLGYRMRSQAMRRLRSLS